jgi:nucleotide-binding universal stress UspA family protein
MNSDLRDATPGSPVNILAPTDFSPLAQLALESILSLMEGRPEAKVTLLHVVEPWNVHLPSGREVPQPLGLADRIAHAERQLTQLRGVYEARVAIETRVLTGTAAPVICDVAQREGCGVIVLCSHGHTAWPRTAIGSVAERVVQDACCPVLVVKPPRDTAGEFVMMRVEHPLREILVGYDHRNGAQLALQSALDVVNGRPAKITLVHALEPPPALPGELVRHVDASLIDKAKSWLHKVIEGKSSATVDWRLMVVAGHPWKLLVDTAKDTRSDLIVVGPHDYSGWRHCFIGSTAQRVVRLAPCSVLAVK